MIYSWLQNEDDYNYLGRILCPPISEVRCGLTKICKAFWNKMYPIEDEV